LNCANSKQDRPERVLISRGAVLNSIRLVWIRRNCTLNSVKHGLNPADHGLNFGKTRPDRLDLRHPRVDSQSYLSKRIARNTRSLRAACASNCIFTGRRGYRRG